DHRLGRPENPEGGLQMQIDNGVPLFVAPLLYDMVPGVARIVDADVRAAVGLLRGVDAALGAVVVEHVAEAGDGLTARGFDLGDRLFRRVGVEVVDYHPGALGGELARDRLADAPTGAGHQCGASVEFVHCGSLSALALRPAPRGLGRSGWWCRRGGAPAARSSRPSRRPPGRWR